MAAWSGPITLYYGEEIGAEVAGFSTKITANCAASGQCDDHIARNMVALPGLNTRTDGVSPQARMLKNYIMSLMRLRASTPVLSSGARQHIYSDADIYIDLKSNGTDRYALVMNTSAAPRALKLTATAFGMSELRSGVVAIGQTEVTIAANVLSLTVPALGAAIIMLEGQ